jgi:hypothetical protein
VLRAGIGVNWIARVLGQVLSDDGPRLGHGDQKVVSFTRRPLRSNVRQMPTCTPSLN